MNLGESHPLYGEAATLRTWVAQSKAAIDALQTAIREEKAADAEEQIAQADLRRPHEDSYLGARKLFGRHAAEQFSQSYQVASPKP